MSSEAVLEGGGAKLPILRDNEPKMTGARSARARSAAKTLQCYNKIISIIFISSHIRQK